MIKIFCIIKFTKLKWLTMSIFTNMKIKCFQTLIKKANYLVKLDKMLNICECGTYMDL
jgi:hypothetical protein